MTTMHCSSMIFRILRLQFNMGSLIKLQIQSWKHMRQEANCTRVQLLFPKNNACKSCLMLLQIKTENLVLDKHQPPFYSRKSLGDEDNKIQNIFPSFQTPNHLVKMPRNSHRSNADNTITWQGISRLYISQFVFTSSNVSSIIFLSLAPSEIADVFFGRTAILWL